MNPQFPVPNSSFSLNPINPNPQFNFPPPPPPPPLPPPQIPLLDLPNSITSLKTLIQSSNSTLQSLTSLIPSLTTPSKSLIQCPSNPNHYLPSTALFLHSLSCPSPLEIGPLVETLQYPKTLKNDHHLIHGNKFFQTLDDPTSELCFSIDDYVDFDTNFFYQDCPAVVSSSSSSDFSNRMFTLPGVLSVECANFVSFSDKGSSSVVFGRNSVKILPSEVWFLEREIEQWCDYPNGYSSSVVRAMLCVEFVKDCDLSMWVIENSPRFGVVIDASMRDHLCVLFRLCLKAMVREAKCSYDDGRNINPRFSSFKCPVLVEALRWLTSQLSILYGEMNSRSLVIALLRHLLSKVASEASLLPLDRKLEAYGNDKTTVIPKAQTSGEVTENEENDTTYGTIFSRPIFVYQIAAAIAALHERSLLEGRIRALRQSTHLTPYQRLLSFLPSSIFIYVFLNKRCKAVKIAFPTFVSLFKLLLTFLTEQQGGNKPKSKEELLAEERDYKRRRMSYRGKKLKRSPKEVMRDIIEDYMEAIKHAGGSGDTAKGDPEVSVLTSTNSSALAAKSCKSKHSSRTDTPDDYRIQLDDDYDYCATKHIHTSRRLEQHLKESYSHKHSDDRRSTSRDRSNREYYSRSPSSDRRRSRSRDRRSSGRDRRHNRSRERNSHSKNQVVGRDERSSSRLSISSSRKDKRKLQSSDRHRWKTHEYGKPDFESVEVNDRYDPSETSHTYDDQLDNSNYTRLTS
ncbi:hypothetical protein KSS87_000036 [Heliosperma pusillum]|nr:hypothetical protein KSS87_000036 [Heliosperma pusillum]